MGDFKKLIVWQKAHELTLAVYSATSAFPRSEMFGVTAQIRRCTVSIAANIAEGSGRRGDGDFGRFIKVSIGSASELEYHLILARDLSYLKPAEYEVLERKLREIGNMLSALLKRLQRSTVLVRSTGA